MAFEVAIFTDVTAAESVTGFEGFQFQSISPGFTGEDMAVVQGELNFVPVSTWGAAHDRDDRSHPDQISFATRDERRYFTKSKALGLTVNGRPGNQLTEAAVTSSLDDLVPYTPAQLTAATAWTLAKAPGKSREPWMTPLQIDPTFESEELERFAKTDPWVLGALPAFVTMLQRALAEDGHRVFVQHRDQTTVLRWIALGSMLLDSASVTRLTFRVFHGNPWNGAFKVVGVHPELLELVPTAGWRGSSSASWIDLETRTLGDTTPSELATQAVQWFAEHGVFEAMGAIQLATQLQPALGDRLGVRAADLLTFGPSSASAATAWSLALRTTSALASTRQLELIESYEDELLDAVVMHQPRTADEIASAADTVAALLDIGLVDTAAGVVAPTIEALAAAPRFAGMFARTVAAARHPMRWSDPEVRRLVSSGWATTLAGAPESELSALFGATGRLGLDLDRSLLQHAAERLADQWVVNPSLGEDRASWYAGGLVEERVGQKVGAALAAGDRGQTEALLRGDWSALTMTPSSPLSGWLRARDLAVLPVPERVSRLRGAASGGIPEESWRLVLGFAGLPIDAELWAGFIRAAGMPDDLAGELAALVTQEIGAQRLAETVDGPIRWRILFDLLLAAENAGERLVAPLPALIARVGRARAAYGQAQRGILLTENAALGRASVDVGVWAMDDLAGTGQLLIHARDRRGAEAVAARLSDVARQALDAYLNGCVERRGGAEGGRAAIVAYRAAEGPWRDVLGASIRRLFDRHRDVERAIKKDEELAPLVEEIGRRYASESGRSLLDPSTWFGTGRNGR